MNAGEVSYDAEDGGGWDARTAGVKTSTTDGCLYRQAHQTIAFLIVYIVINL